MLCAARYDERLSIHLYKVERTFLFMYMQDKVHLGEELSDVLLYLIRLSDKCEIDLVAAANSKIEKNAKKYPAKRSDNTFPLSFFV